jgi:hypothetical protein
VTSEEKNPQNLPLNDFITDETRPVTSATVLAKYPLQTVMTGWNMRFNPRLTNWMDDQKPVNPEDKTIETAYVEFHPWSQTINGETTNYLLVVRSVSGSDGARKVTRDGHSMSVAAALAFLAVPNFKNTGEDAYYFPTRLMTHKTHGKVLAINVTKYDTRPIESREANTAGGKQSSE